VLAMPTRLPSVQAGFLELPHCRAPGERLRFHAMQVPPVITGARSGGVRFGSSQGWLQLRPQPATSPRAVALKAPANVAAGEQGGKATTVTSAGHGVPV